MKYSYCFVSFVLMECCWQTLGWPPLSMIPGVLSDTFPSSVGGTFELFLINKIKYGKGDMTYLLDWVYILQIL